MKTRTCLLTTLINLTILGTVCSLATMRPSAQGEGGAQASPSPQPSLPVKPHFSLSTNRTYSTNDKPRVWISYQGIDYLDFRVYRVKDPLKFFKQLNDPHQMGEQEKTEVARLTAHALSLERVCAHSRARSTSDSSDISGTSCDRNPASHSTTSSASGERRPLNEADYARVPLLNPDQLVCKWREMLTPLENEYDSRNVPLDKQRRASIWSRPSTAICAPTRSQSSPI